MLMRPGLVGRIGGQGAAAVPPLLRISGESLRAAISDSTAFGTTDTVTGWLLPGIAGARLSADSMTGPRLVRVQDGSYAWAPHNLLQQSGSMSVSPWDAVITGTGVTPTVTANHGTAPNGTVTATRVQFSLGGGTSTADISRWRQSVTAVVGATYTYTVWIRATDGASTYNMHAVGVDGLSTPIAVTGSWQQITIAVVATGASPGIAVGLRGGQSPTNANTADVLLWGAQLNNGPTATAYVPTAAAARYAPAIDWLSGIGAWGVRGMAARTNRVLWSRDLSKAAWTKSNATATLTAAGVDGAANGASVLTATDANATALQAITHTSTARVLSIFLRRRTGTGTVETTINGGTDWVARTLTTSWLRFDTAATLADPSVGVRIVTSGDAVDVDIVDCSDGTVVEPPVITQGAAVTRTADNALVPGLPAMTEGACAIEYVPSAAGTQTVVTISDNTANERHMLTNDGIYTVTDGGVAQATPDGGTPDAAALNRAAFAWAADNFAVSLNGAAPVTDVSGTVPAISQVLLGNVAGHTIAMSLVARRPLDGRLPNLRP